MKRTALCLFLLFSANAIAQQPPGVLREGQPPGGVRYSQPPPPAAALTEPASNQQLMNLLRTQTQAIKHLSDQLEALEKRVSSLEAGRD